MKPIYIVRWSCLCAYVCVLATMLINPNRSFAAAAAGEQDVFWKGTDNNLWEASFSPSSMKWAGPLPITIASGSYLRSAGKQIAFQARSLDGSKRFLIAPFIAFSEH